MFNLFIANVKMLYRNKQALFWMMMFPLMFTFIFGMFFGGDKMNGGNLTLIKRSNTELANSIEKGLNDAKIFTIKPEDDLEKAKDALARSQTSAVIVIPEQFGEPNPQSPKTIDLIYDPGNSSTRSVVGGILDGILTQVNYQMQNAKPVYSIEEVKTNTRQTNYFDFVLVGLIGMALMNSSIQGIAIGMSKYKEDKILKRITTTPLKTWKLIAAEILARLILNFIQVSLILLVGVYAFNAHIYGSLPLIFLFSLLGALLFQSIGFAVAALSKTTQAAEGMSTAVAIPMMFLAGVFFPIDQLPKWLYSVIQYLPLAPLLRIIRGIALEEASPLANPHNLFIVIAWIVAMLLFTVWRFRLSEE